MANPAHEPRWAKPCPPAGRSRRRGFASCAASYEYVGSASVVGTRLPQADLLHDRFEPGALACPPNPDPCAMRVPRGPGRAQETLDGADEAHPGTDRDEVA